MVPVNRGNTKSRPIKITYYVSPHEFWFKYEDDDRKTVNDDDDRMQERIDRAAEASKSRGDAPKVPQVGDIVIVQCLFMNSKYIRARVDCDLNYAQGHEFIVWAIDYGFPIRTNGKFVTCKVTTNELTTDNPRVFKATCSGVVPAQPDYDHFEFKTVMRNKPSWSEKAINEFEKIYSSGELLKFRCYRSVAVQHVYGSLDVLLSSGKSVNMDDALKKIDEAMDTENFETESPSLMHKPYWLQQENYKIMENFEGSTATVKALKPKSKREENIVNKVNDWSDMNIRLASQTKASSHLDNSSSSTDTSSNKESPSNTDSSSTLSSQKMKDLPLNKRYSYCSQQNTSSRSDVSTTKHDESAAVPKRLVPESSFSNDKNANAVPKQFFRKVLLNESFSTRQPNRVLVHCRIGVPTPTVSSIADVSFMDVIHDRLRKLGISEVYRTQSVAWPHLMRGHSLILINAAKSGKTWTYLPAVCSLAMEYERIEVGEGPVAVIICLDSGAVNTVRKQCEDLLKGSGVTVTSFSLHDNERVQECHMLNGIDILVTSIRNLERLINSKLALFKAKRLKRVIFDEIDSMYLRFGVKSVHKVYSSLCPVADKQFILTSKIWHKNLKPFCEKDDLMLCIGAYVEAAIYSNIKITVQTTTERDHYQRFFDNFTKGNYLHEPTVIVCNKSEEVRAIKKHFRNFGLAHVTYCEDDDGDTEVIDRINKEIGRNNGDAIGVLVCTDGRLADLRARNAQHIIHYSLPDKWTNFAQRFVVSFDYYQNMVGDGLSSGRPTSTIYVDQHSSDSMPRLVEFMKTRCYAEVPKDVLALADKKRMEQVTQNKKYVPFCNRMLLFGVCDTQDACSITSRHFFSDLTDRAPEHFPRNGKIKFEILCIHSPAHFTVRILEHRPLGRTEWQKPYLNDASTLRLQLDHHFSDAKNQKVNPSPKVDDLCVIQDDDEGETFKRCKVIFIDDDKKEKRVWLIDSNAIEKVHKSQDLYVLPEKFQCYPAQAVDIRIAGIVPLDLSATWDKCVIPRVRQFCDLRENCHLEATIKMTIMKCIWVESIEIVEKLTSINEEVRFEFRDRIVREKLGDLDKNAFPLLQNMAERSGLLKLVNEPLVDEPAVKKPLVHEPIVNEPVDIPHTPIQQMTNNNQERGRGRGRVLSGLFSEPPSPGAMSQSPSIPQSPVSSCSEYGRSPVPTGRSIINRENDLFDQRKTPPNTASKPVKRWAELKPNEYIEVDIGEFYSPDRIYVLLASEFKRFNRLRQRICNFAAKMSNLRELVNVEVGALCLALCENSENDFRRAQILRVNGPTVNIFLLDYGVEENNVPVYDLIEIPQRFITCLPFQAILCNMIGIAPSKKMSRDDSCLNIYNALSSDSNELFVRWSGDRRSISYDLIECNSYDVVFLDRSTKTNINQFVVQNEFADYDPHMQHLVDVEVDWNCIQLINDDEEEWDEDEWDGDECDEAHDPGRDNTHHDVFKNESEENELDDVDDLEMIKDFMQELVNRSNSHSQPSILDSTDKSSEMRAIPHTMPDLIPAVGVATVEHASIGNNKPAKDETYQLESTGKMPHIVWRQDDTMVHIKISAPDVKNYSLKVTSRSVHFCFDVNQQRYEDILNLFGCVDAKYTSHEVQGLNIVVRLMKTRAAEHWPRLEKCLGKNQFIKCVVDEYKDSDDDEDDVEGRAFLPLAGGDTDSVSSDDDEDNADVLNSIEM